tara:strand:+ start:42 stop:632 length:591 start_codon:yes stop_codon:yes gene_type:complete
MAYKMKPGSKETNTPGGTSTKQTETNKKLSNSSFGRFGNYATRTINTVEGARNFAKNELYGSRGNKGKKKSVKENKTPTNTGAFNNFSKFSGAKAPDTSSLYDKGKKFNLPSTPKASTPKAESPKPATPKETRQARRSEKRADRNTKRIKRLEKSLTKQQDKKKLSRNKGPINQAAKAARISNLESRIAKKKKKTY